MNITFVTGTGTDVGKTIAVAGLAVLAAQAGRHVAVVKPIQTGLNPGEPGDLADVERLTGLDTFEFVRYPDPLSPEAAARRQGVLAPSVAVLAERIRGVAAAYDEIFVEGAGGLLVRLNSDGETFADLARELGSQNIVVVAAGLGTLNHTALTLEAAESRHLPIAGLIVGSWPAEPDLACQENLHDLATLSGQPLLAALPAGLGSASRRDFLNVARASLTPLSGG